MQHLRNFLSANDYPIPDNDYDVVHIARALMKVKFPCGWRESFEKYGRVILHAPGDMKGESDE